MVESESKTLENLWRRSRAGAWAGRGFHYQHRVSTVLAVRLLTGALPPGRLVPEGLEDCVIEFTTSATYLQIKSKAKGPISLSFAQDVLDAASAKALTLKTGFPIRVCTVFEHPIARTQTPPLQELGPTTERQALRCLSPTDDIIGLLCSFYDCPPVIAQIIGDAVYARIADIAALNAGVSYAERQGLSVSDIAEIATRILQSVKGSRLEDAMLDGTVRPVVFLSSDEADEAFYLGVKTRPIHVAAGLVFDRPDDLFAIEEGFFERKPVMVKGPSGCGKSALMWSFVHTTKTELRWFEIVPTATLQDLPSITLAIRALLPSERSPVALAADEVTEASAELWAALCRLQFDIPHLYLVGTIRSEDSVLLHPAAETKFITPTLDDDLAELIWQRLRDAGRTEWMWWKEPFDLSEGLTLEYVHILTEGSRLATVIAGQVQTRRAERRFDELRILRVAAAFGKYEAQLNAAQLLSQLEIDSEEGAAALTRLLDEHLVREVEPGVLGGLHALRSQAISEILLDDLTHDTATVLARGLSAVTPASLPNTLLRVDQSRLFTQEELLSRIVSRLRRDATSQVWTAAFAGLGLMSLNRYAAQIRAIIDAAGLPEAQANLATMLMLVETESTQALMDLPQFKPITAAVEKIQALEVEDFRVDCLTYLDGPLAPICETIEDGTLFLRSLIALPNGKPLEVSMRPAFEIEGDLPITRIIDLLSAAYAVSPAIAVEVTEALGGEDELLAAFCRQTPFITPPELTTDVDGERAVRSNYLVICQDAQPSDIHGEVVRLCEALLAMVPTAHTVMSDAITPDGAVLEIGGYPTATKCIPRKNLALADCVSWNVALRSLVLERSTRPSRTQQITLMSELCERSEKVFRTVTEKWVKSHRQPMSPLEMAEAEKILAEAQKLEPAPAVVSNPLLRGKSPESASKAAVNGSIFGEIFGKGLDALVGMQKREELARHALALFDIEKALKSCASSPDWQNLRIPCPEAIDRLAFRMQALSEIAMVLDEGDITLDRVWSSGKGARAGRRVMTVLDRARRASEKRLTETLDDLTVRAEEAGLTLRYWLGKRHESHRVQWPRRQALIGYDLDELELAPHAFLEVKDTIRNAFVNDFNPTLVPLSHGQPIIIRATRYILGHDLPIERNDFIDEWSDTLELGDVRRPLLDIFLRAIDALTKLSGLVALRRQHPLRSVEADLWDSWLDKANSARDALSAAETDHGENVSVAVELLHALNDVVADEEERALNGRVTEGPPLCGQALPLLAGETESPLGQAGLAAILLEVEDIRIDREIPI